MRAWWARVGILLMVAGGSAVTGAAGIGQEPAGAGARVGLVVVMRRARLLGRE